MSGEQKRPESRAPLADPLRASYRQSITAEKPIMRALERRDTALLCIDLQYLDALPDQGIFGDFVEDSLAVQRVQDYYFTRLYELVLPNTRRIQDTFREANLEVIHVRIQSLTRDGRDRGPGHKRLGLHAAPGSKEAEFIAEVAPVGDEIIINKTASGVFSSTNLAYVLRNLGINSLFVAGVYTNECISTAVRDACDLGYYTTIIEDCCAAVTPQLHASTISTLRDRYSRVLSADEAIAELQETVGEE